MTECLKHYRRSLWKIQNSFSYFSKISNKISLFYYFVSVPCACCLLKSIAISLYFSMKYEDSNKHPDVKRFIFSSIDIYLNSFHDLWCYAQNDLEFQVVQILHSLVTFLRFSYVFMLFLTRWPKTFLPPVITF